MIWITRRDFDSGEQTTWIKQSLPQRHISVGYQLNSDQALRLRCLKGHVRARDSTLWRPLTRGKWILVYEKQTTLIKQSLPQRYICVGYVWIQQWSSTQITFFERTGQSAWPDAVTTIDKKRVNSCVRKYLFWREFSNQKKTQKNPEILAPRTTDMWSFFFVRTTATRLYWQITDRLHYATLSTNLSISLLLVGSEVSMKNMRIQVGS